MHITLYPSDKLGPVNGDWQHVGFLDSEGFHNDVIKWKHFLGYRPFVRGIHRWPVNSPHKGQWCGALMFSLICTWINGCINNREPGDLRHRCTHYDIIVILSSHVNNSVCIQRDLLHWVTDPHHQENLTAIFNSQSPNIFVPVDKRTPSQYKDGVSRYWEFHYKDKMVVTPSLYNGNPYTGKTTSLYWDSPLDLHFWKYMMTHILWTTIRNDSNNGSMTSGNKPVDDPIRSVDYA